LNSCAADDAVADKQRFELFATFVVEQFPAARRIFDVAGGLGKLNEALLKRDRVVTTFDRRHKHLPVQFCEREFGLDEPCECELVVGMHPDGATRIIIEYAARHGVGFAVVPCCSDNSMPYNPWMRHLREFAEEAGLIANESALAMAGRNRVLWGAPPKR
jgi:hypothetical protein